jgi:hypothetical protein
LRFSLSLGWGFLTLSLGKPEECEHPAPSSPVVQTGDLHDTEHPGPFPFGFTLPSTRDPWEGWAEE